MNAPCVVRRRSASAVRVHAKEIQMPKGQQRSNKETKKPKQTKKASVPASSTVVPPARSVTAPGKQR